MSEQHDVEFKLGWKSRLCTRCGHEWFREKRGQWWCARCQWADIRYAPETAEALQQRLLSWIDAEIVKRAGDGSYARGQRSLLTLFRDQVKAVTYE
jgi:predicted  nucleic acid-binding Zn-ribbon protein